MESVVSTFDFYRRDLMFMKKMFTISNVRETSKKHLSSLHTLTHGYIIHKLANIHINKTMILFLFRHCYHRIVMLIYKQLLTVYFSLCQNCENWMRCQSLDLLKHQWSFLPSVESLNYFPSKSPVICISLDHFSPCITCLGM